MRNPSSSSSSSSSKTTSCCSKIGLGLGLLKKGPWTKEEDELLSNYISKEGEGRWRTLPKRAGLLRCGKSCRLRWMNYLRPNVKRGHISSDEEDLILRLHRLLGNRWSLIAGRIPGRTDNEIKNYWNTHLSKKLLNQGIDPRTHKPLPVLPQPNPNPNPNPNANPPQIKLQGSNNDDSYENPNSTVVPNNNLVSDDNNNNNINGYFYAPMSPNSATSSQLIQEHDDNNGDHDHDHMMYCSNDKDDDDVFSSFLNSLINDDMFPSNNPQNGHDQQQLNAIIPPGSDAAGDQQGSDVFIDIASLRFGFEADHATFANQLNQS